MSEIVIKGMALPKQGIKRLILLPDGEVREICGDEAVRATDARAVEIPPHGELVERDKISSLALEIAEATQQPTEETIFTALREVPVILEASK